MPFFCIWPFKVYLSWKHILPPHDEGVIAAHGREELGEGNLSFDSLKSGLNRDMEEKGIVLPELSCQTAGGGSSGGGSFSLPGDHIYFCMVSPCFLKCANISAQHWSAKSYLCTDWRGVGKWVVICKCVCFLRRSRRRNWLACLVTVERDAFRDAYLGQKSMYRLISKFVCVWHHQRLKTTPHISGKVLFS